MALPKSQYSENAKAQCKIADMENITWEYDVAYDASDAVGQAEN